MSSVHISYRSSTFSSPLLPRAWASLRHGDLEDPGPSAGDGELSLLRHSGGAQGVLFLSSTAVIAGFDITSRFRS